MKKTDLCAVLSLAGVVALTARVYPSLAANVVTHFDASGEPNGWMSRATFAWFCPLLGAGVWAFHRFVLPRLTPGQETKRATYGMSESTWEGLQLSVLLLILGVHVFLLRYALVPERHSVQLFVPLLLGCVSLVLALILPRVTSNPFVGIRVPWTRSSPTIWAQTHRAAGYTYFAAFISCVVSLFLPAALMTSVAIASFLTGSLAPVVYSAWLARRAQGSSKRAGRP